MDISVGTTKTLKLSLGLSSGGVSPLLLPNDRRAHI